MIPPETRLRSMTALFLTRRRGEEDEILLLWKTDGRVVKDVWCPSAGGHFEPGELDDPCACVLRELYEETGLTRRDLTDFTFRYVTLRAAGGEIRQNYYYFARLSPEFGGELSSTEGKFRWFGEGGLEGLPMPWTARAVLKHWLRVGRFTDGLYSGAAQPDEEDGAAFAELNGF